jgi:N-acetylneuraminic acid mutarotase
MMFCFILLILQTWQFGPPMPTPRYGFGIGVVNNKIYVIGGYNDSIILNGVEVYDPITNSWDTTNLANLPTPRYFVGSAVYDNKIYIIGGTTGPYSNTSLIERYDPVMNEWDTVKNLPYERAALGACVYQNRIYAIGGFQWDSLTIYYENKVEYLSPPDTTWYSVDPLNTRRSNLGAAVCNNKIYALGGSYFGPLNSVEFYFSDNWYYISSMPNFRTGLGVANYNDYIYAIGGGDSTFLNSIDILYEPDTAWLVGPPLNQARARHGVAIVGDSIYVIGGKNYSGALNTMEFHELPLPPGIEEQENNELEQSCSFPTLIRKGTRIDFAEDNNIRIYNSIGVLVLQGENSIKIDLPQGVYFVRLQRRNNLVITKKIVVVK